MDKVYLLLRNNQEKGPFTFDELLQQKLKPFDLIWVEGKSEAWAYPEEFNELKHLVSSDAKSVSVILPQPVVKEIIPTVEEKKEDIKIEKYPTFSPKKDLEKRAEEVRARVLTYKQEETVEPQLNVFNTNGYYNVNREIPVSYKTNRKLVPASHLVLVAIASVLTAGWLYGDWSFINPQPGTTSSAVTTYNGNQQTTEEHEAKEVLNTQTVSLPIEEVQATAIPVKAFKKGVTVIAPEAGQNQLVQAETVYTQQPQQTKPQQEPVQETVQTPIVVKAEKEEKPDVVNESNTEPVLEKKKKGGFLKGLFKKKKKDDDNEVAEAN